MKINQCLMSYLSRCWSNSKDAWKMAQNQYVITNSELNGSISLLKSSDALTLCWDLSEHSSIKIKYLLKQKPKSIKILTNVLKIANLSPKKWSHSFT